MTSFEILSGMPASGPYPEQFTLGTRSTHGEGFVLRVIPDDAESWVGNYQRGGSGYDAVHFHPNGSALIIVAGGQAYVVEPRSRRLIEKFGGGFSWSEVLEPQRIVLLNTGLVFTAYGASGQLWQTRRL
jgi:hypothetical protein